MFLCQGWNKILIVRLRDSQTGCHIYFLQHLSPQSSKWVFALTCEQKRFLDPAATPSRGQKFSRRARSYFSRAVAFMRRHSDFIAAAGRSRRAAPPLPPSIHPARRVWLVGSSLLSFLLCTSYPARRRRRPRLFRRRSQSLILASSAASGPHTLLGDRTGAPSNGYDLLEKGRFHY